MIPKYHNILKNVSKLTKNIFHFIHGYSNKGHLLSFMQLSYSCCYAWRCCYAWNDSGAAQYQAYILGERETKISLGVPICFQRARTEIGELQNSCTQESKKWHSTNHFHVSFLLFEWASAVCLCMKRAEGGIEITTRFCSTRMERTE